MTADDLRGRLAAIFADWESARWEEDLPNTEQVEAAVDRVLALVTPELTRLRDALAREQRPLAYQTTCRGCADTLAGAQAADERAEAAEAALKRVRTLADNAMTQPGGITRDFVHAGVIIAALDAEEATDA